MAGQWGRARQQLPEAQPTSQPHRPSSPPPASSTDGGNWHSEGPSSNWVRGLESCARTVQLRHSEDFAEGGQGPRTRSSRCRAGGRDEGDPGAFRSGDTVIAQLS